MARTIALPPGWAEAFAKVAAHYGIPLPQYLRRLEIVPETAHQFRCGSCGRGFGLIGRYPELPIRDEDDPFSVVYSMRIFASGVAEVYGLDGERVGLFCPGCAKIVLEPAKRWMSILTPREVGAMSEHSGVMGRAMGFVDRLFSTKIKAPKPQMQQPQLPPKGGTDGQGEP